MKRPRMNLRRQLRKLLHDQLDHLLFSERPRCEDPCPFCAAVPPELKMAALDHMVADAGQGYGFMVAVHARHPEEQGRVKEAPEVTEAEANRGKIEVVQ